MSNIIKYQPNLPSNLQRQLDRQNNQMECIAQAAMTAMGEQSKIYSYAMFEAMRTLNTIVMLKKAFPKERMTPETDAALQNLIQSYLYAMAQIPQEAGEMIRQLLEKTSFDTDDDGLLGTLMGLF
jgi:hypothetical protein